MKGTPTLRLVVAALVGLYPLALLTRSAYPALAATVGLLALTHARWRFAHAVDDVRANVRRQVEPREVRQGDTAQVILTAEAASVPGATLRLDDEPPTTLRLPPNTHGAGSHVEYTVRADLRGRHEWGPARVTWRDASGLWTHSIVAAVPSALDVQPALDATGAGRRGAEQIRRAQRVDPLGIFGEELEMAGVRPFQPGDRGRNIDWKRISRDQGVLVKDWERQARPELWVLLDASWTMRTHLGGASKLDHATALGQQMVRQARAGGIQAGFAVFDAHQLIGWSPPRAGGDVAGRLRDAVAGIPAARPARRRILVGTMARGPSDLFSALQVLHGRVARSGIHEALRQTDPAARPVLVVLTDAHGAGKDLVDGARAASQQGARCVVGLLADDDYFLPPAQVQAADLLAAAKERRRLAHVQGLLAQGGVRSQRLTPDDTAMALEAHQVAP